MSEQSLSVKTLFMWNCHPILWSVTSKSADAYQLHARKHESSTSCVHLAYVNTQYKLFHLCIRNWVCMRTTCSWEQNSLEYISCVYTMKNFYGCHMLDYFIFGTTGNVPPKLETNWDTGNCHTHSRMATILTAHKMLRIFKKTDQSRIASGPDYHFIFHKTKCFGCSGAQDRARTPYLHSVAFKGQQVISHLTFNSSETILHWFRKQIKMCILFLSPLCLAYTGRLMLSAYQFVLQNIVKC